MPNIFRPTVFNEYCKYVWFEKNILDEIKSNNLSNSKSYLETAMDAQHGGFPSRLLDVSFNSLVALFFAVTPYYKFRIDEHDDTDGRVIVFATDKMSTSNTQSIINIFDDLIVKKRYNSALDCYFHMLIDFVDLNNRIKAQQGGFILFGGNQFVPIPESKMKEIIIPSYSKKKIRDELNLYFGINMGMIYPEVDKKVDYITSRSLVIQNEIDYYSIIKDEIEFNLDNKIEYLKCILNKKMQTNNNQEYIEFLNNLTKYIYTLSIVINEDKNSSDAYGMEKIVEILIEKTEDIYVLTLERIKANIINPNIYIELIEKLKLMEKSKDNHINKQ